MMTTRLRNRGVPHATLAIPQPRIIVLGKTKVTNKVKDPVEEVPKLSLTVDFQCRWWVCYITRWSMETFSSNHYYVLCSEPLMVCWWNCKEKTPSIWLFVTASKVRKYWGGRMEVYGWSSLLAHQGFHLLLPCCCAEQLVVSRMKRNWLLQLHRLHLNRKWSEPNVHEDSLDVCFSGIKMEQKNSCWSSRREGMPLKPVSWNRLGLACRRAVPKDLKSPEPRR